MSAKDANTTMVRFEEGDLSSIDANDRDLVQMVTKQALLKVWSATDLIPRTVKGNEARELLGEAAEWLIDLREGIKAARG